MANSEFVGSHYNCGQLSKFSFLNVKSQFSYFMVQCGAKSELVAFVSIWQNCIREWMVRIQKTSIENFKWGLLWDNFRETTYGDPQRRHVTHNPANVQNAMWKCVFCSSKWRGQMYAFDVLSFECETSNQSNWDAVLAFEKRILKRFLSG